MKKYLAWLAVVGLLALGVPGHASTLSVVGTGTITGVAGSFQLIYDADKDITWLDYSAPVKIWGDQVNWAANLSVNFNGQNITGWRLPTTVDDVSYQNHDPQSYNGTTSFGYNNTTSEMGHLFYAELGNKGQYDTNGTAQDGYGLTNTGVFKNLVSSWWYCSGTKFADLPSFAWGFDMRSGAQFYFQAGLIPGEYALAVLPGLVTGASVPEPSTLLLIGSGLAALAGMRRKK